MFIPYTYHTHTHSIPLLLLLFLYILFFSLYINKTLYFMQSSFFCYVLPQDVQAHQAIYAVQI